MLSNSTASGIETRKFTVTQDFLYGQANSEGKDRFLVFHDKERNPYQVCPNPSRVISSQPVTDPFSPCQHRFVPSQYVKFGEGSLKKLKKAGFGSETLDLVSEHTKAVVGDELRDFSGKARPATGLAGLLELFD